MPTDSTAIGKPPPTQAKSRDEMMSVPIHPAVSIVAGTIFCTIFVTMNTTLNYIALPAYLLPRESLKKSDGIHNHNSKGNTEADPDLILRQWELTYSTGHMIGPGTAIFGTLTFLYAARALQSLGLVTLQVWCFTAAICTIAVVPFTVIWILPTNDELYRRAESLKRFIQPPGKDYARINAKFNAVTMEKGKGVPRLENTDTLTLIRKCHSLSKIRAIMPIPSIIIGFYAISVMVEIV